MSELLGPCPTCFKGRCPTINTTPDVPEPNEDRIDSAIEVIPDILIEHFKIEDRFEAVASRLLEYLLQPAYGSHKMPAAKWAVHRLIQRNMLSVHEWVQIGLESLSEHPKRRFCRETRMFYSEQSPKPPRAERVYGKGPVAFDEYMVRAEKSLWEWWRAANRNASPVPEHAANSTQKNNDDNSAKKTPTYRRETLCAELTGITTKTLNKYATLAGIKKDGSRFPRSYTREQRLAILNQIAKTALGSLANTARDLLEQEPIKNENGNLMESRKSQGTL